MKFDGSSGKRPSAEARRYVYRVLASSLLNDIGDPEGWIRGGLEEFDDRRAVKQAKLVAKELQRKGTR